ncbi:MAG: ABC transporter permease [Chitinophagaceae bacterium]|nr:MAG: ABC transporter permease [Chitinophagaceae bacterium]
MLRNYFKTGWRNIIKNPFYSGVKMIGLGTGIAFTLLIGAYVWNELQVNRNLKNINNQYILQSKWKDPDMGYELSTSAELPKTLKNEYPGLVANYYRWDGITTNVSKGDKYFREGLQIGDSTLLDMYGFSLLYGDARTAFTDPFSVVLTADKAIKYFGKTDVIGQTLTIESFSGTKHDFAISGVLKKPLKNSVINFNEDFKNEFYLSRGSAAYFGRNIDGWDNTQVIGYVELQKGITPDDLEKPMQELIKKNASAQVSENMQPYLVSLKTYYLSANNGVVKKMLRTLSFIALFILLMAVINFINLCISRSSSRIREMGIRKVLGGLRKQLIGQFLTESILLVMLATAVALLLYQIARPFFSNILGKELLTLTAFPLYFILIPILLALFIGILAGIYPAFVLSSMKSADSIKGKLTSVKENVLFRKSLVAFQFGTAAIVFIGALIISQQVNLFFSKSLGYNKEYILYAQLPRDWSPQGVQKMETIRYQFAQMPEVNSAALSFEIPNGANSGTIQVYKKGTDSTTAISSQMLSTDNQYSVTYNIPIRAGSFFTPVYNPGDSSKIVINETQSKALGWNDPQEAIGQQIRIQGFDIPFTICGVTSDFHFGSMQEHILPVTFMNVNFQTIYRFFSFKLRPGNMEKSIAALQKKWSALLPAAPFEYNFMDDALKRLYRTEIQLKKASYTATVLALIIVLLGVLGLISQSIQKRTKEIGVRKVLGSSVAGIITLFIREFLSVLLVGGIIACPLAYLIMNDWLMDYAYRVQITSKPFIISIVLLGMITALLITLQTFKAATTNPVKSLRTE